MGSSGTQGLNKNFEEFDNNEANMTMKDFGQGSYAGGLNDKKWDHWQ